MAQATVWRIKNCALLAKQAQRLRTVSKWTRTRMKLWNLKINGKKPVGGGFWIWHLWWPKTGPQKLAVPSHLQLKAEDRHHAAATWSCHSTSLCLPRVCKGYRRCRNRHIGATNATNATGQAHPHNAQDAGCPTEDKHIDVDNAPLWAHPLGHMCLPLIRIHIWFLGRTDLRTDHPRMDRTRQLLRRRESREPLCPARCQLHHSFTLVLQNTTAQWYWHKDDDQDSDHNAANGTAPQRCHIRNSSGSATECPPPDAMIILAIPPQVKLNRQKICQMHLNAPYCGNRRWWKTPSVSFLHWTTSTHVAWPKGIQMYSVANVLMEI